MTKPAFDTYALPRKRIGAAALFFNEQREILVVNPTYRSEWLLPGGTVEVDESPRAGCRREVFEELGLVVQVGRLLCVDYVPANSERNESLQFIFDGGVLSADQMSSIRLPPDELSEFLFVEPEVGLRLLVRNLARRLARCLTSYEGLAGEYLDDGA